MVARVEDIQPPAGEGTVTPTRGAGRWRSLPAWVAFFLLLPWSVTGTYLMIGMAFFLSKAGVSTAAVAAYLSATMLPDTVKILWAPSVDAWLGPRRWHAIGVVGTVALLGIIAFQPITAANLPLLTVLSIACGVMTTFIHLSTDVMIAYDVADEHKGKAGGWNSASNVGGGAIGGGLAIYLAQQHLPAWIPTLTIALICLLASPFVLLAAPRPPGGIGANIVTGWKTLFIDVMEMVRSRKGMLTLFLVVLPIGASPVVSLLPALAKDWHASVNTVVFISGVGGGVLQLVGALVGGAISDRMHRKGAYCLLGAIVAVVLVAMGIAPRTPTTFVVLSLVFLFASGASLGTFTAMEFDTVGRGSAATKCMLIVCIYNLSFDLFTLIDGILHDSLGIRGMLLSEAGFGLGSVALFGLVAWLINRRVSPRAPSGAIELT